MKILSIIIITIVALFLLGFYPILWLDSCENASFTVQEKERVVTSDSSKYLVFTENEVFENVDSLMKFKFNSSDVYGDLKVGESYTYEVCGWRIPFLSWYRNIIK